MRTAIVRRVLLSLSLCMFAAPPVAAEVRILASPGGEVGSFLALFEVLRRSGRRIVIDGPCYSACTLVLGIVPRDRICVTGRARLGFHAAWAYAPDGSKIDSPAGTASLWRMYPSGVRNWISRKGGLSRKMLVLSGRELTSMYRACR